MSGSSTCRSCGRPIVWAVTPHGKNTPLDPEPKATGNLVRIASMREGRIHYAAQAFDAALHALLPRYFSHFATCPDAKNWRHHE